MGFEPRTVIILLAAGNSSRMKRTKQLLPWKNSTLLGDAIRTAVDSDAHTVVVVLGAEARAIQAGLADMGIHENQDGNDQMSKGLRTNSVDGRSAHHNPSGREERKENQVEFVDNTAWASGLGSSIACGIRHISRKKIVYDAALIQLADQPLIDTDYLNVIMASFAQTQVKKAIIATAYEKRAGVPALFSRDFFESLVLLSDDQGAQKMINDPEQHVLILDPGDKTVDIDTKSEYENLRTRVNNR